jgi:hypothetical protein
VPRTPKAVADPPGYDPAVHTDPKRMVRVDLFCTCGGVWRQRDPVELVVPYVQAFVRRHDGDGHGPATIAEFVEERETRKQAALRATGNGHLYQPKTFETLDPTCTAPRPWPVLPEQQEG